MEEKLCIIVQGDTIQVQELDGALRWSIAAAEIVEIAAWKEDNWSYDVICFGFRRAGETGYFACNEEAKGWDELQEFLKAHFGIKFEDWFERIAFPAFAANFKSLWGTPTDTDSQGS